MYHEIYTSTYKTEGKKSHYSNMIVLDDGIQVNFDFFKKLLFWTLSNMHIHL